MRLGSRRCAGSAGSAPAVRLLLVGAGLAAVLGGCGAGNPHRVGTYERGAFFADGSI